MGQHMVPRTLLVPVSVWFLPCTPTPIAPHQEIYSCLVLAVQNSISSVCSCSNGRQLEAVQKPGSVLFRHVLSHSGWLRAGLGAV